MKPESQALSFEEYERMGKELEAMAATIRQRPKKTHFAERLAVIRMYPEKKK